MVEGTEAKRWWLFGGNEIRTIGFTDGNGYIQIVDLPPGSYTMKLVTPGTKEPVPIQTFDLERGYRAANISGTLKPTVRKEEDRFKIDEDWLLRNRPGQVQPKPPAPSTPDPLINK
jgi:hypothetical protein